MVVSFQRESVNELQHAITCLFSDVGLDFSVTGDTPFWPLSRD